MGRTWGEIQNEILGLMFSNNTGGTKISPNDSSNKEYTINMADSFNCGLRNIYSYVKPLRRFIDIEIAGDDDIKEYNLKELCKDNFISVLGDEVFVYEKAEDGKYVNIPEKTEEYDIYPSDIFVPHRKDVKFRIFYKSAGFKASEDTPSEEVVDIEDIVIDAVCYFAASRLYMEDDVSIAIQYLNMFEQMKQSIALSENTYTTEGAGSGFKDVRGWL